MYRYILDVYYIIRIIFIYSRVVHRTVTATAFWTHSSVNILYVSWWWCVCVCMYFRIQVNNAHTMCTYIILFNVYNICVCVCMCAYKKDKLRDLNFKTRGNRKRLPAITPRTGCSQIRKQQSARRRRPRALSSLSGIPFHPFLLHAVRNWYLRRPRCTAKTRTS